MKRFIIKFAIYYIPFITISLFYIVYIHNNTSGDIGSLAKIPFGLEYQNTMEVINVNECYVKNVKANDIDSIKQLCNNKIVTIGDSFSQLGQFGYQQYLGVINRDTIFNVATGKYSPEQKSLMLLNNDVFDDAKSVIIESVERESINRLAGLIFSTMEYDSVQDDTKTHKNIDIIYDVCSWIRLRMGIHNPILYAKLDKKRFSHDTYGEYLYFYQDDINFIKYSQSKINSAQQNLERLFAAFNERNVQLIYVVAANKYDLYSDYIIDNIYPKDNTMELLSMCDTDRFINTKELLLPHIQNGEKDIYLVNDTHWSYKASKIVGEHIYNVIKDSN